MDGWLVLLTKERKHTNPNPNIGHLDFISIMLCSTMWNTKKDSNTKLTQTILMRRGKNKKGNVTWRADGCFIYLFLSVDLNHLSPLSFSRQMWHWGMPLFLLSLDGKQTQLLIYCRGVYKFEWWGWGGRGLTIMGIVICPSFVCICKPLTSSISPTLSVFFRSTPSHSYLTPMKHVCMCS